MEHAKTKISELIEQIDSASRLLEIQRREIEAADKRLREARMVIRAYKGTVTRLLGHKPRRRQRDAVPAGQGIPVQGSLFEDSAVAPCC